MDRRFYPFGLAAVAVVIAAPVAAQDAALQGVIADQLQAFVARDATRAFDHASPMIQGMFATPEMFAGMVAEGYPMVWDNAQVRFGVARSADAFGLISARSARQAGPATPHRTVP